MQRRAAAIFAVFFLVIASGAYALITVGQAPTISPDELDDPRQLSTNDTVEVDGRTYTVGNISSSGGGGGEGGGGEGGGEGGGGEGEGGGGASAGSSQSTKLTWVNESARQTATIENNSTLVYRNGTFQTLGEDEGTPSGGQAGGGGGTDAGDTANTTQNGTGNATNGTDGGNGTGGAPSAPGVSPDAPAPGNGTAYRVLIPNTTQNGTGNGTNASANVSTFTLREQFNATAMIANDPAVEDDFLTGANGTRYVQYRENGTAVPLEEYLPAPEERTYSQGEQFPYTNNSTAIEGIGPGGVSLAWEYDVTNTVEVQEGNVTLNGQQYVAAFSDGTLYLSQDVEGFLQQQSAIEDFHERINGLWAIVILSGLTVILLLGIAFLPVRG